MLIGIQEFMVDFYTSGNMPINVGFDKDADRFIHVQLKPLSADDFGTSLSKTNSTDLAQAFYGDGPYSLEHPNNMTDFLAQNIDYLA